MNATQWLILALLCWAFYFAVSYVISEFAQEYLYNSRVSWIGVRVAVFSLIMALVTTYVQPSWDTMFSSRFLWTVVILSMSVLGFLLILEFEVVHAVAVGFGTMLIAFGMMPILVERWINPTPTSPVRAKMSKEDTQRLTRPVGPSDQSFKPLGKAAQNANPNANTPQAAPGGS